MIEVVLDSSVLLKWLRVEEEEDRNQALYLEERFRDGQISVAVPPLLFLEALNIAGRRWRVPGVGLARIAERLEAMAFIVRQPSMRRIAYWTGQGLTAYDGCYVALAEERRTVVVTTDRQMLAVAPSLTHALSEAHTLLAH